MLIEAYSAAASLRIAIAAGAGAPEQVFYDQMSRTQGHVELGVVTKAWIVAFMQIRCLAIGHMYGMLGDRDASDEFGRMFGDFFAGAP